MRASSKYVLSNILIVALLILLCIGLSPGRFEIGQYRVNSDTIRFTPALATYLQHDYVDVDKARPHNQQFRTDDYPRRYNFNFDEADPVIGPKSMFIPSTSENAIALFNGVPFGKNESLQLFAPGLGHHAYRVDIPRMALTPGNNRADIHYTSDVYEAGLRDVFIGPTETIQKVIDRRSQHINYLPKVGAGLSLLAALLCLMGVLVGKFSQPFAVLGGVTALALLQFCLSFDMGRWAAMSYHQTLSILLPLLSLILLFFWWRSEKRDMPLLRFFIPGILIYAVIGQFYGLLAGAWPRPMPGTLSGVTLSLTSVLPLILIWPLIHLLSDLSERRSILDAMSMKLSEQEKLLDDKSRTIATEMQKRAVLEERQRFTRDIHDGIGGQLLSLLLKVRSGRVGIDGVANEIQAGINDLRLVVDAMDHTGDNLDMALSTFKGRTERQLETADMKLDWNIEDPLGFKIEATRDILNLYRLMQEAVSNAIRHAGAKNVRIDIASAGPVLNLSIQDDGKGFDIDKVKAGKGLKSIRERAQLLGAKLDYGSGLDGKGFGLILSLPARS